MTKKEHRQNVISKLSHIPQTCGNIAIKSATNPQIVAYFMRTENIVKKKTINQTNYYYI